MDMLSAEHGQRTFCAKKVSGGGHSLNTNPTHIFNHIPECIISHFQIHCNRNFPSSAFYFPELSSKNIVYFLCIVNNLTMVS